MLIGIDANEANSSVRAGIGQYAYNILWQLYRNRPTGIEYRIYLKEQIHSDLPMESAGWKYQVLGPKKLWTQIALPLQLWREKLFSVCPDVFFSLTHYAPRFCPTPSVICIMDLAFLKYPDFFLKNDLLKLKHWTAYSIKQAEKIITISENSKRDIVNFYQAPKDKIIVAYPGYDNKRYNLQVKSQKAKIEDVRRKYHISGEYILFLGTLQPRKNIVRLLEAFIEILKSKPDIKLVICGMNNEGRGGWLQNDFFSHLERMESREKVVVTGFADKEDVPFLIGGAKAFVLPSLYEGFGITVLEAMATGIPVVVSQAGSIQEVCGKAAIYIKDPHAVDSIVAAVTRALMLNGKEKDNLIESGYAQARNFSWETAGKKVTDALLGTQ